VPIPIPERSEIFGKAWTRPAGLLVDEALAGTRAGIRALLPDLPDGEGAAGPAVRFSLDESLGAERYRLVCGESGAAAEAGDAAAAVFAAATVRQLLEENGGRIPRCSIEDGPRFGWRGVCMDVCRHFFPAETLRKLIDVMALYKYNRLHLHLSDDQGFRFGSERFPLLAAVGSQRKSTLVKRGAGAVQDGAPHGGYYTKDELRDLVRYAKARGIEIVPEIDVPGHALAMLAAYPELMCFPEPVEVATSFGVSDFSRKLLCAGSERVYEFLFSLLDELTEVFPFGYVHLGGDEAVKTEWARCPRCRAAIKEHGLGGGRELQGWMLSRLSRHLEARGRRAIVWNDGLSGALDRNVVCQYWTPFFIENKRRAVRWVNDGGEMIWSGFLHVYFDYPYAVTPLKKTYRSEPVPRGILPGRSSGVLGAECAAWTEWIDTEEKLFFNLLPRLAAAAEAMWSPKAKREYRGFLSRLQPHYRLYERLGLPYARRMENSLPIWKRIAELRTFFRRDTHAELAGNQRK